jgi:plastocyanin
MSHRTSPRKRLTPVIVAAMVAGLTLGGIAAGAAASVPAKKKPPVKLEGKVNNEGTAKVKGGAIDVKTNNFFFDKTFLKSPGGETVSVSLENVGNVPHTFTIDGTDVDRELAPGASATVDVEVPDSGAVAFYCRFHKSSGMQGAFFTAKGAKAGTSTGGGGGGGGSGSTPTTADDNGSGRYGY